MALKTPQSGSVWARFLGTPYLQLAVHRSGHSHNAGLEPGPLLAGRGNDILKTQQCIE